MVNIGIGKNIYHNEIKYITLCIQPWPPLASFS